MSEAAEEKPTPEEGADAAKPDDAPDEEKPAEESKEGGV